MWIEPKTDWQEGDSWTVEDWNRIVIDTDYLLPLSNIDEYMATSEDFMLEEAFVYAKQVLMNRADEYGLTYPIPGEAVYFYNINALEYLLLIIKRHEEWLERQAAAMRYVGEDIYVTDTGKYSRAEEYVRD